MGVEATLCGREAMEAVGVRIGLTRIKSRRQNSPQ
jgi:hypothetical protein